MEKLIQTESNYFSLRSPFGKERNFHYFLKYVDPMLYHNFPFKDS